MYRSLHGLGDCLGRHANHFHDADRFFDAWSRHGQPLRARRRLPELLRFLPKPGAWMETFKQISGFVLLATVVFILSYIETLAVVPTLALLLGIAVACWIVARTPFTAEFGDRVKSWAIGGVVVGLFVSGVVRRVVSYRD